jgi:hypothetical protein
LDDFFFEKSSNSVELFFKHKLEDKDIRLKTNPTSPSSLNSSFFLNQKNLEKFVFSYKNNLKLDEDAESIIKYNNDLKKNKSQAEIEEDKNIFLKNIYISNGYEFEFYQNFLFFFKKTGKSFYNKKEIRFDNKIYLLVNSSLNFFSDFSIKNFLNFKRKKIFYFFNFVVFFKNFYLNFFYFFFIFKKTFNNLKLFKSKINFNKICNSFFFFNKSSLFLNSSIFHSILNISSNSFFFFLYKFFYKFKTKIKTFKSTTPFYLLNNTLKNKIFFNVESKISNQFLYLNKFFLFFFENFFKSKIFFKIKFFKKIYNFIEKKLKMYNFYSKFN